MKRKSIWSLGQGVRILDAKQLGSQWLISAAAIGAGVCPDCGKRSTRRHGWHERHLQDLPAQGAPVIVKLRLQRWQCRNGACKRMTFTTQLPAIAGPQARRTVRVTEVVYLIKRGRKVYH
ncbi:transposase family protein [Methylocystis hirsuta]|uniref:transposase family protein n=1 Tax=Methylocystis hirsuta TaxID=369798 RepID=UPI003CCB3EA8